MAEFNPDQQEATGFPGPAKRSGLELTDEERDMWHKPFPDPSDDPADHHAIQVESQRHDPVDHPAHYDLFPDLEVVDAIRALLTPEEFRGYLKGNILKYRLRAGKKDDKLVQDIGKAMKYEDWLWSGEGA